MIRINPGRSWRMNPAYVGELRSLDEPRARRFSGADILDVLGIVVDGVDIAAGVGEGRVLLGVDELAQALLRIGNGAPAAQATVGPGPTELLLEAHGHDLLLSLVSLAPPARVVAGGLLVDAQKMRAATLHAARGLLLDLLAISPVLGDAPLAQRLGDASAELSRRAAGLPRRWPSRRAQAKALVFPAGTGRHKESLQIQLPPETMARLRGAAGVPDAPLAPHLGQGTLALTRAGGPGLACEGVPYLLLRNLLFEAERLVEAWETGARELTLKFGPHELRCDLTTDQVLAPGWRKATALPALRLARLIASAAQGYAAEARDDDEIARDLGDRAAALLRHCADLETGDLRRAAEAVTAPAAPSRSPGHGALSPGRMRRLVYTEAFRAPAAGALRALPFAHGPLLIEFPDRLEAVDGETGDPLWKVNAAPGAVARGLTLFYAEPGEALVALDMASGEARWKRKMRGAAHPARLWALPFGVARSLPGEGLALVSDAGALSFRVKLPGGAPSQLVAVERTLVTALGAGALAGLEATDGRVLWKRRCKPLALLASGPRALALCDGALLSIDAQTGEPAWECDVPAGATALLTTETAAFVLGGGSLMSFSLHDGSPRKPVPLAWARHLAAGDDPDLLVATGEGGAVARVDASRWSLDAEPGAPDAPAQVQRGIVLVRRANTCLYGADGILVAQLPPARNAVLSADLSCALLFEGELAMHRLATHLSVV